MCKELGVELSLGHTRNSYMSKVRVVLRGRVREQIFNHPVKALEHSLPKSKPEWNNTIIPGVLEILIPLSQEFWKKIPSILGTPVIIKLRIEVLWITKPHHFVILYKAALSEALQGFLDHRMQGQHLPLSGTPLKTCKLLNW